MRAAGFLLLLLLLLHHGKPAAARRAGGARAAWRGWVAGLGCCGGVGAQGDDHEGEEDVAHDVHSCQGCWGVEWRGRRGRRPPPAAVLMPPESMHAQYPSQYPSRVLSTQIPVEALVDLSLARPTFLSVGLPGSARPAWWVRDFKFLGLRDGRGARNCKPGRVPGVLR
jgi:hypothetical protein